MGSLERHVKEKVSVICAVTHGLSILIYFIITVPEVPLLLFAVQIQRALFDWDAVLDVLHSLSEDVQAGRVG